MTALKGDILDAQCLKRACQGMSAVIHTAAAIDPLGAASRQTILDVNLKGNVFGEDKVKVGQLMSTHTSKGCFCMEYLPYYESNASAH